MQWQLCSTAKAQSTQRSFGVAVRQDYDIDPNFMHAPGEGASL